MAHIFVKNSLNTDKAVKLNVTIPYIYDVSSHSVKFVVETATTYLTGSGTRIPPVYLDKSHPGSNLSALIDESVSEIVSNIDWAPLLADNVSPYVSSFFPTNEEPVSIDSTFNINIVDDIPSAGIDMSEAVICLNNGISTYDITEECSIKGDPFRYSIEWKPTSKVYKKY